MKQRQALKITKETRISDLVYAPDTDSKKPLMAIGVRKGYKYSWIQFKKAFRITKKYYERIINRHESE